jgi:hypothetical protein
MLSIAVDGSRAAESATVWKEFPPPATGAFDSFDLYPPKGYKLCSPPAGFPASNGDLIPVDASVACDQFDQNDPDHFPDAVRILEWADAAMQYNGVKELARDACSAKAAMRSIGKAMGGLDTVICDEESDRGTHIQSALAYLGAPQDGFEIRIVSIAHPENRERAEALLHQLVAALRLRPPAKR